MKKLLICGGCYALLQIVNSEILSGLVLLALAIYGLAKFFPYMVEGTK